MARLVEAPIPVELTTPLAGRDSELSQLDAELQTATADRSFRVALISGPESVGRSSLLRELERRWSDRATIVSISGSTSLKQLASSLARTDILSSAHPERRAEGPKSKDALDLGALIHRAAHNRPLVVAIDDADKLDPESAAAWSRALSQLAVPAAARSAQDASAGGLIILTSRDESLRALAGTSFATVALRPFDAESLRRYLAQSHVADRLLNATGGVPGRIEALFDSPSSIDLASRRIERLQTDDREILSALALLERPESIALIAAISGRADATRRLAALAQTGWLSVVPDLGRTNYALARASDRKALLFKLAERDRTRMLRAAAETYLSAGESELAFRALRSAGDVSAACELGLSLVGRVAPESAQTILEALAAEPLAHDEKRNVLLRLAVVLEARGEIRSALAAIGRARALSAPKEKANLRARAARLCIAIGAVKQAEKLAQHSRNGDATVALAEARFLHGAYVEAIATVDAAANVSDADRVALENVRGKALLTMGRLDEAKTAFGANAGRSESAGLRVERVRALLNVGVVAHRQGNRDEARASYREALAAGDAPFTPVVHANLSSLLLEEGEIEDALAQSHKALSAFAAAGRIKEQSHAAQNLGRIYLFIGDVTRARDVASYAGDLARRVGDPYLVAGARLVAAETEAKFDELEAIAAEFERLGNPRYRCESLLLLADAEGTRAALDLARNAGALRIAALVPEWHLLAAELAIKSGDLDLTSASLSAAREGLARSPHIELPARLYALTAKVAELRGEPAVASAENLKAVRILDQLAAKVPVDCRRLFYSRPRRRAIYDQAGRELAGLPIAPIVIDAIESTRATLVGKAPAIVRINELVERIGPSNATVLVRGESGTGKELVAHALHERSSRRKLPMVAVNCGALPEDLLLSELFGHERGAFTGAIRERKGRFELADGGTIFLDEIGDISPRAQVALLRVLQERTFERVGGSRTISVDVRIVCATNRPLEELMKRGQFREDLYYRLRGTTLTLPPLRAHSEDIAALCDDHLARAGSSLRLSREALAILNRYDWPGNVRELFNLLESAALLATGNVIGPEAFELYPELLRSAPRPAPAVEANPSADLDYYAVLRRDDMSLRDLRRQLDLACIGQALKDSAGNISEAARLLKIKRSRLSQIVNEEPALRALCGADEPGPKLAVGDADD